MRDKELERECEVFTRHIVGRPPTPYVLRRYADAHAALEGLDTTDGFERWLLRVAHSGPVACRVADAWARLAAPRSVLRRKLVVLLAILEVSPPFAAGIDQPRGGATLEWARMVGSGLTSLLALVLGVLVFLPARLLSGVGR